MMSDFRPLLLPSPPRPGRNWEAGFVRGLAYSMVFVPLISRGAIEGLLSLGGEQDCVDNVLLGALSPLPLATTP